MTVISDKIAPIDTTNDGLWDYFNPSLVSATDYYPFGMGMPGRGLHRDQYKFGFNGQEHEQAISEGGNHTTATFWEYDSRLGRRWNLDPIAKHNQSNYIVFSNSPIVMVDPKGDDDYFFSDGTFLFRSSKGSSVKIATKNGVQILSESKICNSALSKIGRHYAQKTDVLTGEEPIFGGSNDPLDPDIMSTQVWGGPAGNDYLGIVINNSPSPSEYLNDHNNFINAFVHEYVHFTLQYKNTITGWEKASPLNQSLRELRAYDTQVNHDSWVNTTSKFKEYIISLASREFEKLNIKNKELSISENLRNLIEEFNSNKSTNTDCETK